MIRKTMILAIATAFIAGSALTSIMLNFEAEAKDKSSIDDVLVALGNLQADVDEIQELADIHGESSDDRHSIWIDVLSVVTEDLTEIKETTDTTSDLVIGQEDILQAIKDTGDSTNSDVDTAILKLGAIEENLGIGTSP